VKSACADETLGVQLKMLSQPPPNSIAYSSGPIATFVTLYAGEGSVSKVPGPEVWISESELVSTLYFECSFTQAAALDHFASQSAPARQVIGFGGSATDACCSAVMQPHNMSADAAAIEKRRSMGFPQSLEPFTRSCRSPAVSSPNVHQEGLVKAPLAKANGCCNFAT
jgi:hypothetical protein